MIRNVISNAFDQWVNRFDYTTGQYAINVNAGSASFAGAEPFAVQLSGDTHVQVGASGGTAILIPLFGLTWWGGTARRRPCRR